MGRFLARVAFAAMVLSSPVIAGGASWNQSALAFEANHPELKLGQNYQIMQSALNRQPASLSNADALRIAYAEAVANPAWTREAVTGAITWDSPTPAPPPTYSHSGPVASQPPGNRCISPNGMVYYTQAPCWTPAIGQANAAVEARPSSAMPMDTQAQPTPAQRATVRSAIAWQQDQVQGLPGAVMVGPDQALNPYNGHIVQLETAVPGQPNQPRVISAGGSAEADIACDQARRAGWSGQERSNCSMGLGPDGQP